MPYSGASDPNLPSNVKKMPSKRRRQWVSIFNRTMASCTGDDCEAKAFRIANGVLKRQSKDMDIVPVQCQCGECEYWSAQRELRADDHRLGSDRLDERR